MDWFLSRNSCYVKELIMRFLNRTPVRTFIPYPLITLAWEWVLRGGSLVLHYWFLPMMLWGAISNIGVAVFIPSNTRRRTGIGNAARMTRLSRSLRFTRNPMYLGHLIF